MNFKTVEISYPPHRVVDYSTTPEHKAEVKKLKHSFNKANKGIRQTTFILSDNLLFLKSEVIRSN